MAKNSRKVLWGVLLAGGASVIFIGWRTLVREDSQQDLDAVPTAVTQDVVALSRTQVASVGITVGSAEPRNLQPVRTVPGRLQYDDTCHVQVKAPLDGAIREIRGKPGDRVAAGDVLAVLSSPELGNARADVLLCETNLDSAERQLKWEEETCDGLERLIAEINRQSTPEAMREVLKSTRLGTERERILTAYSRMRLADQQAQQLISIEGSGAVSRRIVQEAVSERDMATAALDALIDELTFAAHQEREQARAAAADAERRLQVSRDQVNTLLGLSTNHEAFDEASAADSLSAVKIRASLSGTIESRQFSATERVVAGDWLFVLANTETLWVAADIREREWSALQLGGNQALEFTSPAVPGRRFEAHLYYVGREVDPVSNAVPLVCTVKNSEGLLRPGQFVRISLPVGPPRDVLAVPEAAVVEHDGQAFVFEPDGDFRYRRVEVEKGITVDGWTEIQSGLQAGQSVVVTGAFTLKSELLLAAEAE